MLEASKADTWYFDIKANAYVKVINTHGVKKKMKILINALLIIKVTPLTATKYKAFRVGKHLWTT